MNLKEAVKIAQETGARITRKGRAGWVKWVDVPVILGVDPGSNVSSNARAPLHSGFYFVSMALDANGDLVWGPCEFSHSDLIADDWRVL